MIATCRYNTLKDLPAAIRNYAWGQDDTGLIPLTVGNQYIVCGLQRSKTELILIIDDKNKFSGQPWWYPIYLFDITDTTEPSDWVGDIENSDWPIRSFPEIVNNDGSFNNLLQDGRAKEVGEFLVHYKKYAKLHGLSGVGEGDLRTAKEIDNQKLTQYKADLKTVKERGWEPPDKPTSRK